LRENMEKMHIMAEALMKYETIDHYQIDDIMDGKVPRPPQSWEDTPPPSGPSGASSKDAAVGDGGGLGKPATQH
ncbi:MAG: cell division protein FtsH, partial [Proteobacteria bacterium]|nr:cell division protein FtsH [Pseudomonadota bacterium]